MAEKILECPLHGKVSVKKDTIRRAQSVAYSGRDGSVKEYELPEISKYRVSCRICFGCLGSTSDKCFHDLAIGFSSDTEEDLVAQWNSAVCEHTRRMFNKAVTEAD